MLEIGAPRILPLGGGRVLPYPFSTIRKAEGDMTEVLYVSIIQGLYLCTQTAASQPIRYSVPGDDLFMYTGKRPEGVKVVSDRMRIVSTTVHPAGSWSRFGKVWRVMLSPLSGDSTVVRGLARKMGEGSRITH